MDWLRQIWAQEGKLRSLDSAYLRVERAGEHLTDLESRIHIFIDVEKNRLASQFNPNKGYLRIRTFSTIEYVAPPRWGILIGEIAYNLRTALDYLVYELAFLNSGVEQDDTQFPIEHKPAGFKRRSPTYLKGLSVKHVTIIEDLQPYKGTDWTHRLALISNPDKHRLLTPIINVTENVIEVGSVGQFDGLPGHIHRTISASGKSEMDVYADFALSVTFNDGLPVIETLQHIQFQVRNALDAFNSEFK